MTFKVPEQFRVRNGQFGTDQVDGNNGLFFVSSARGPTLRVIASDGEGWDHVSVSLPDRCPIWSEMCRIKSLFWGDDDAVMQLHPPKSEWVNNHPFCLHLWRPQTEAIPAPNSFLVGIKEAGTLKVAA